MGGLERDGGNAVEVGVVMKHSYPVSFRYGGDK